VVSLSFGVGETNCSQGTLTASAKIIVNLHIDAVVKVKTEEESDAALARHVRSFPRCWKPPLDYAGQERMLGMLELPWWMDWFCPRVPVHESHYKGPNNTQQLTNDF